MTRRRLVCLILLLCLVVCPAFSACSDSGTGADDASDVSEPADTKDGDADKLTMFHEAKDAAADALAARMNAERVSEDSHVMILSYDTDNIYIQNAAFAYDNALALMAFTSDGRQEEA